jgi:arsenate reductase
VITVCDNARERCPFFPSQAQKFHHNFPDPAKAPGSEEDVKLEFGRVRAQIKDYCEAFVEGHLG